MAILWLDDSSAGDLDRVGGKAASLGELTINDLPVPPAFVVTADTYRSFLEDTGIDHKLTTLLDVDAVRDVQNEVMRVEQRCLLEAVRE